jgi:hypothetical protein
MPVIAHPYALAVGAVLFLIGIWAWRWSSRHAIDLKGAALGAAWQGARSRKIPDVPDDLKSKFDEIANETSNVKRAQKAGGTVARHFVAQVMGIVGLIGLLGGIALMAAGVFWK